ncbi:MAG: hypothetical protein JSV14_07615 [Deltaproteobacteria bacterium]|jgi:hypothetical protein|nr:MAG: hypothetical protein JSV14_07615 [Deltaproteobacteria bacterium]
MTVYLFNTVFAAHLALIISSADCYTNMGSIPLQIYAALARIFHESLAVTTDMAIGEIGYMVGGEQKS